MIFNALTAVGGQEYLERQAKENPVAFLSLLAKTLPRDVNLPAPGGLSLTIDLSKQSHRRAWRSDVLPSEACDTETGTVPLLK